MLMLSTDGELCSENEYHSTSWLLCPRDIKLGSGCHFLSPLASLKLLFLSCGAERWTKTMESFSKFIKANQTNAGWRIIPYSVKPFKDF